MPVYEYTCPVCSCRFELIRPISRAEEDAPCPDCATVSPRALSRFAAVTRDAGGASVPVGGSGCGGCSSSSCASCG